ncbi:1-phosphofructokinase [Anaerococcus sp. AGMB09787]|uniref:1-phosphofructokinase n=1 Tax=Anaerococcus sp. AGMB09787 TaxID=2922869 RepID=UPI001FAFEED3|nr:1-phosphofructokinase [Anaerococcus sp. AGMB09787]
MIYTLSLNPALDHIVGTGDLKLGETNRMTYEKIKAGGKGINVTNLLKNLGEESLALGFVGGFTGRELIQLVRDDLGLDEKFIKVKEGFTRINVKIKGKVETEINGPGLDIDKDALDKLFEIINTIEDGDYLFLSGSIPDSLGDDFYGKLMDSLADKKIKIIVDASGPSLTKTLTHRPYLIKPNLRELEGIFGVKINTKDDLATYARKLREMGAENVIVSLGGDGAYMINKDNEEYFKKAYQGKIIDTVGSGDSMVGGFVYGKIHEFTDEEAFKFAVACGSATAFSPTIASKEEIYNLYEKGEGYENN